MSFGKYAGRERTLDCKLHWYPKVGLGTFILIVIGKFPNNKVQHFQPIIRYSEGVILFIIIGDACQHIANVLSLSYL